MNNTPMGLNNIGSTCYMNSSVQCLANTPMLTDYFLYCTYVKNINTTTIFTTKGVVANAWWKLLFDMWCVDRSNIDELKSRIPREFKYVIDNIDNFSQFKGCNQQDVPEFLRKLLESLHEDLNKVFGKKPTVYPDYIEGSDITIYVDSIKQQKKSRDNSIIDDLFCNYMRTTIECSENHYHQSITINPDYMLLASFPDNAKSSYNLDELINCFSNREIVEWHCKKCKKQVAATKTMSIWSCPDILVINLKRFKPNQIESEKINKLVNFPLELDMSGFIQDPRNKMNAMYDLYATSNHGGGLEGGHYWAYVKNGNKWYKMDDDSATPLQGNLPIDSSAYILFYKRRKPIIDISLLQQGGKDYYSKYLKYKQKYLALKNSQ
jgi:ubiquitin carboxyl-terminal hydrolase 8